jgi:hypothetical protein
VPLPPLLMLLSFGLRFVSLLFVMYFHYVMMLLCLVLLNLNQLGFRLCVYVGFFFSSCMLGFFSCH